MQRCTRCYGSKKYAPMGGIYVTCLPCNGTGLQPIETTEVIKHDVMTLAHSIGKEIDKGIATNIETTLSLQDKIEQRMRESNVEPAIKKKPGRKPGWNKVKDSTVLQCSETSA